ncbi:MAG TPA: NAD(P)-dependent oxidoreductase [Reyranella sp.]|nr:NAD(P)-dependent oxidoreductase [Reyranella sp.]
MPKTLFIDSTPDIDKVWKRVHGPKDIAITINMGPVDEKDVPARAAGYDTVINDATYFSAPTLEKCRDLRHIVFLGTGAASFVDVAAAQKLGIKVSTISGYGDTTVAEHAMGLVFAAARHIATMHGIVRGGAWRPMAGMELRGKTLGIVGLGGIGCEMARIAQGIGLKVLAYNRTPKPGCVPLDELLAKSDIVSLHLGLNDETRGFIDRGKLAKTRPGVILVNTARAGVVDEAALIEALRSGQVGHYATDVFNKEPVTADEPLLKLDNVTLTSHAGYNTPEAAMTMYRRAIDLAAAG